jgi:hypothetical protein
MRCFVFGPPSIYVSRHSSLNLQGVVEGLNYLHRSTACRKRRRKWNPVMGIWLGHPLPGGYKYGELGCRLGKSRIWGSKIWFRVLRDSEPRMTALAKNGSICKRQTRPLLRERPTSTNPQLFDSNKNSSRKSPRWVLDTNTDWPTDHRS